MSAAKRCVPPSCLTVISSVSKGFMARRCVTSSKMNHTSHPHLMALQRTGRQILLPRLLPAFFITILQLCFFWKPEMLVQHACETPCLTGTVGGVFCAVTTIRKGLSVPTTCPWCPLPSDPVFASSHPISVLPCTAHSV